MTAKSFTGSRDDLRAKIKDMREGGFTASQMSRVLGITRCAVLGHVNRMGLPALNGTMRTPYKSPTEGQRRLKKAQAALVPDFPAVPVPAAPEASDGKPEPVSLMLTIEQVGDKTCRWPKGTPPNLTFCGNTPHTASPYCEFHSRKAWSKPHAATQFKGRSTVQFHR